MEQETRSSNVKNYLLSALLVIILILLDQVTKAWAVQQLYNRSDIVIIPNVLQLHYLENTGAAFSLLEQKMMLFYILTPILVAVMIYFFHKLPKDNPRFRLIWLILIFLCAGAIGNYIDRIIHAYVIDFIYFSLIDFPIFNVADIYVTCSVIALFIVVLFYYKEDELDVFFPTKKKRES